MIVIHEELIGKSSQYLKMEWLLSWSGSWKLGVCKKKILEQRIESPTVKLLGVRDKLRLHDTELSFTQQLDLIELCKCRVTKT